MDRLLDKENSFLAWRQVVKILLLEILVLALPQLIRSGPIVHYKLDVVDPFIEESADSGSVPLAEVAQCCVRVDGTATSVVNGHLELMLCPAHLVLERDRLPTRDRRA